MEVISQFLGGLVLIVGDTEAQLALLVPQHDGLAVHAADPSRFTPARPDPRTICLGCHQADSAKPRIFKQVNIEDAMDQARRDAGGRVPVVAHRRSFRPWLVTMEANTFFRLLRGDFPECGAQGTAWPQRRD